MFSFLDLDSPADCCPTLDIEENTEILAEINRRFILGRTGSLWALLHPEPQDANRWSWWMRRTVL